LKTHLRNFATRDDGAVTIFGLYLFLAVSMIGAIALDVSYLRATKTQLQVAADQSAHAAIYRRSSQTMEQAQQDAVAITDQILGGAKFKGALTTTDIEFGTYVSETNTFVADSLSRQAVRVVTSLERERDNAAQSFLFRMVGIEDFEVLAEAVYTAYKPGCLREGLVAEGVVDLQSNNSFLNGFCVHSNSYVSLNQNNFFETGTVVSMPNIDDLDLPKSGFEKNEGLDEALRNQKIKIRILDQVKTIDQRLRSNDPNTVPDYIWDANIQQISVKTLSMADLEPGHMYEVGCTGSGLTIDGSAPLKDVVIITDCDVKMSNGAALENVLLVTTSTSDKSITSPNGFRMGVNDNCAPGGGAQIVTAGGFSVASGLELFGSQIIAQKDVSFAAAADGVGGASIISAASIDGTSQSGFGFCNSGMEDNISVDYYRMVR